MIADPRWSLTETKSSRKESSFRAKMPLITLIGAANLQSPSLASHADILTGSSPVPNGPLRTSAWEACPSRDSSKMSAIVPQEHQIRMRSDERDQ